jgi:hypothetical protein
VANTSLLPNEVLNERLVPSYRNGCNIVPLLFCAAVFENIPYYLRGDSVLLLCPLAILIRKVNFEQVAACICLFPLLVKGCFMEGKGGETSSHVASHGEGCFQPPQLCLQIADVIHATRSGLCQQRAVVQIERRV